jgi:hypothetical protein
VGSAQWVTGKSPLVRSVLRIPGKLYILGEAEVVVRRVFMNPSIVKNYRAILTLTHPKPRTCELLGDDLNTVKTDVTNILGGGGVTFTPSGPVILVYHPSFQGGKKWLGEITSLDVTEDMSVGAEIERLATAA